MKAKSCKWIIGMMAAAFLLAACGNKETTAPAEEPSAQEDTADTEEPEETPTTENPSDASEEDAEDAEEEFDALIAQWEETGEIPEEFKFPSFPEPTCPYIGLTIPEILDEGFNVCGYGSMSGGSIYQITISLQKDYAYLNLSLNVDSETYDAYRELDGDEKMQYLSDHFSGEKMTDSNCDYHYLIYTRSQLEACAADGNCTREASMEGKTYGELMAEGYQESDEIGSLGDDIFIKFCDENYQQGYIIMLDLSEKGEEVDTFDFWSSVEPRLKDYTVMAAYAIK